MKLAKNRSTIIAKFQKLSSQNVLILKKNLHLTFPLTQSRDPNKQFHKQIVINNCVCRYIKNQCHA